MLIHFECKQIALRPLRRDKSIEFEFLLLAQVFLIKWKDSDKLRQAVILIFFTYEPVG